jgi:Helix-turn-helix domain
MSKPSVRLAQYRELWQRQIASDNNLTASARLFGVAISWHLNQHTLEAWPSLNTIAVLTAMSNRTVIRGIKELETHKHLRILRTRTGGKNDVNHYIPLLRAAAASVTDVTRVLSPVSPDTVTDVTLTSDLTSDRTSTLRPRLASRQTNISEEKKKEVGEGKGFLSSDNQTSPLAQSFREVRELFGDDGASIVAKAIRSGVDDESIREVIDEVRDYGGDAEELAHALYLRALA